MQLPLGEDVDVAARRRRADSFRCECGKKHLHPGVSRCLVLRPLDFGLPSILTGSSTPNSTTLDVPGLRVCTLLAGDTMYVPPGWQHAILDLGETVGANVPFDWL